MTARSQPCVLVVEDESELRELIAESLSDAGFAVAQAPTGTEALARLKAFAYDALVVDLKLPDGDGMDILDAAVARYPEVFAVVMTGFGGVTEAVQAIKKGAIDFLIKPFQLSQLTRIEPLEKDTHVALLKSGVRIPLSKSGYARLKTVLGM